VEKLRVELVEDYLGGRGLATRIFCDVVDPGCDPLGEENAVVIATSPLLGTEAPTACWAHMVFKSPLTGIIGSSNCGGSWATAFKSAGFDVLLIRGKVEEPVMIDISSGDAEIKPASNLWGLEVHQTADKLLEDDDQGKGKEVLCIGPAGEKLVLFASVVSDRRRAWSGPGAGAVFGSKKLKAIRVGGKERVRIRDEERYRDALERVEYLLRQVPVTKSLLRELGTPGFVKIVDEMGMLPHLNFQNNIHCESDLDRISGETLRKSILERQGECPGCLIGCLRYTRLGDRRGEGPEYDPIVMLGPDCGIYDLEAVARTNYRCSELGLDTVSFGGTVASAMELYERGYISSRETGGIELNFGKAEMLEKLAELTAWRKGVGELLADGSFRLAGRFKHAEYSMSVKKLEIPGYDPRASFIVALIYMTSPTGACHLQGGSILSPVLFSSKKRIPAHSLFQAPAAVKNIQNLGIIQDSLGICRFTQFAFSPLLWAGIVIGVTGFEFSSSRLEEIAERVAALERVFNLRAGVSAEEDTLPSRFIQEPMLVGGKEVVIPAEAIRKMREEYYEARGWDKNGKPAASLLRRMKIRF
ncbi:MAG: aldehyde ferredoxin oxidoreductase family protein, partial [Candidatus Aminicenantales bacterium]